ncbi:MAG: hypothetical protein VKM92_06420 [Cyanobacteriota bacterium]|nr:hypothetical protein [Cyanobacteriota bacterium]
MTADPAQNPARHPAQNPAESAAENPAENAAQPSAKPLERLTPPQRALLQIVCWVAWADGDFALQERTLLETLVARLLQLDAADPAAQEAVRGLAVEPMADGELASLVAVLDDRDARRLAVKLALQMVSISQGPEDESAINPAEKQAYRRLLEALALSEDEIRESEWAARQELERKPSLLELLSGALQRFGAWPSAEDLDPRLPLGYWL